MRTMISAVAKSVNETKHTKSAQLLVLVDGHYTTYDEAQRHGHHLRDACETCRKRKLRCSGVTDGASPCQRCLMDNCDCVFGM